MKGARFSWKSTCTTCRDARAFLRDLGVELDERDYARTPLTAAELELLFKGRDPRDFINPRNPAYKAMGLAGKALTRSDAIALMTRDPNLLKRPIVIVGGEMIAGFDRSRIRDAVK